MIKAKWFSCCVMALLSACPVAARAEVTYVEITAHVPGSEPLTVIRMTVAPAPEPVPALRYRFIARDVELKPGNAAPFYYRALMELPRRMEATRQKYNEEEELYKWYGTGAEALPVDQLPSDKVRDALAMSLGGFVWEQLTEAAQRRDCDWDLGIEEMRGIGLISLHLSEFQQSREIARMLALRTRLAVAERRYDDAVESMRMSYRLGRDTARPPILVCGLIGIAISSVTNGTLIELIAAPDSPNLYWALADLAAPPIDMRPAARFELDFGPRMFPVIHEAETTERSPQEWNRLFTKMVQDLSMVSGREPTNLDAVGAGIVATGMALLGYPHAKQQLIADGMDPERIENMAVGQVMAIYTERVYRHFADQFETRWHVPYWEMRTRARAVVDELRAADPFSGQSGRELLPLVDELMPALHAARTAQVRLERDIAAMRVIEALRMHAAAHDGRLPERLDEVDLVPVPLNPATGRPFAYRREGSTAILDLPSGEGFPGYNRRFEIQIASHNN